MTAIKCCICEHEFEPEDMASCPAYSGPICSLCCSLDARCHDLCKPHARLQAQVAETARRRSCRSRRMRVINSQVGRYLAIVLASAGLVGLVLGLIYLESSAESAIDLLQITERACGRCSSRCC